MRNYKKKIVIYKICSERFILINYIKCLIKTEVLVSWKTHWNLIKKEYIYIKMKTESHWNQNKNLKNINRFQFFTFIQMKLDHNYFKFYLNRLSDYNSDKYHLLCHQRQTSEHFLTTCHHFKNEQLALRRKLKDLLLEIRILFILKEEIQAVLHFLKEIRVGIRKWLLGEKVKKEID